jgi:hypothetical protein
MERQLERIDEVDDEMTSSKIIQVRKTPSWPRSWANFCLL